MQTDKSLGRLHISCTYIFKKNVLFFKEKQFNRKSEAQKTSDFVAIDSRKPKSPPVRPKKQQAPVPRCILKRKSFFNARLSPVKKVTPGESLYFFYFNDRPVCPSKFESTCAFTLRGEESTRTRHPTKRNTHMQRSNPSEIKRAPIRGTQQPPYIKQRS